MQKGHHIYRYDRTAAARPSCNSLAAMQATMLAMADVRCAFLPVAVQPCLHEVIEVYGQLINATATHVCSANELINAAVAHISSANELINAADTHVCSADKLINATATHVSSANELINATVAHVSSANELINAAVTHACLADKQINSPSLQTKEPSRSLVAVNPIRGPDAVSVHHHAQSQ